MILESKNKELFILVIFMAISCIFLSKHSLAQKIVEETAVITHNAEAGERVVTIVSRPAPKPDSDDEIVRHDEMPGKEPFIEPVPIAIAIDTEGTPQPGIPEPYIVDPDDSAVIGIDTIRANDTVKTQNQWAIPELYLVRESAVIGEEPFVITPEPYDTGATTTAPWNLPEYTHYDPTVAFSTNVTAPPNTNSLFGFNSTGINSYFPLNQSSTYSPFGLNTIFNNTTFNFNRYSNFGSYSPTVSSWTAASFIPQTMSSPFGYSYGFSNRTGYSNLFNQSEKTSTFIFQKPDPVPPAHIVPADEIVDENNEPIGLANPASVFCIENGGTLEMRQNELGTYGVCMFSDGSECEEWAYFRGECAQASSIDECMTNDECDEGFFCQKADNDCDGIGSCVSIPQFCTRDYRPVCGCDGRTYPNACSAASNGVNIEYTGECTTSDIEGCMTNDECGEGFFCQKTDNDCDGIGSCVPIPQICTMDYNPVCGCDGNTYGNACSAAGNGVNIDYRGECN